jgi:hypothetical protein
MHAATPRLYFPNIDLYIYMKLLVMPIMDHSPINQNFEFNKSRQKFHHSLKEHHKISNIPKFRCEKL